MCEEETRPNKNDAVIDNRIWEKNLQAKEKLWYTLREGHCLSNQMNEETPGKSQ